MNKCSIVSCKHCTVSENNPTEGTCGYVTFSNCKYVAPVGEQFKKKMCVIETCKYRGYDSKHNLYFCKIYELSRLENNCVLEEKL